MILQFEGGKMSLRIKIEIFPSFNIPLEIQIFKSEEKKYFIHYQGNINYEELRIQGFKDRTIQITKEEYD